MASDNAGHASDAASLGQNFLKVIVDPRDRNPPEKAEVDIVAVHGLNPTNTRSHAEMTWTKDNKMWLKDFLPNEHPTARVMLFGYNANVAFETSVAGVLEHATNLLNLLWLKRRKDANDRPLIFIAHSLGGIVVKRALVWACQSQKYRSIQEATYGLVFFGTPHRGGHQYVPLGKLASKIARTVCHEPKNTFLEALEKDSLFADTTIEDFKEQLKRYRVISFYEARGLPNFGIIVDKKSAVLGLDSGSEDALPLDLDHRNICKFASPTEDAYEQVSGNIGALLEDAIESRGVAPTINATTSDENFSPQASPMSEDVSPAVTPMIGAISDPARLIEDSPYPLSRAESGLGIQRTTSSLDVLSMADSVNKSRQSIALSDSTEGSLRRQSTSTAATSAPSMAPSAGKYTSQSPRLASSIKMNLSDSKGTDFRSAAANGNKDVVKKFIEEGIPIDNSGVWDGYTALADAARHGQEAVVELLLNEGANPAFDCLHSTSKCGSKHNTPLSLAAGHGHLGCMRLLMERHQYTQPELNHAYRAAKYKKRVDSTKLMEEYGGGNY